MLKTLTTRRRIFPALFLALLFAASNATAIPVTWNLDDVVFDDGGSATGSFTFDAGTGTFSSINITTSANGSLGASYGEQVGVSSATTLDFLEIGGVAGGVIGFSRLLLSLDSAMMDAGGTIGLALTPWAVEGVCTNESCTGLSPLRHAIRGSITTVPEPVTLALMGLGLAGFGYQRRKQIKAA